MKFLYFGDRHATFKQPSNRIDDFIETSRLKELEVMEIAKKEKVSAILQPGDFFEEKDIKGENKFIQEIIDRYGLFNPKELLKTFQETGRFDMKLLEEYIPMVCVAGNHDLIGESLESLPSTTLGLLSSLGQLNLVTKDNPIFFTTEDGKRIAITGTNYHIGMDEPQYIDDYIVDKKLGDYHIHIVHGMLSDKDMGKLIKHTLIDNIVHTKADITLCGHNHIGFGILKIDEKYFVNIGSLTRYTGDIKEIKRVPSVALIDINASGIEIKEIPLKSAPDGASVIDRSGIEEDKKRKATLKSFKDEIKSLKTSGKSLSIKDFVDTVATAKAIEDDLKKDILDRIVIKETENSKIKNERCDAYITNILLENFQSHKNTSIDLSEGFNVLVGESRQGKSAIERSFYWVYENKPSGKNFIKRGCDFARVTITLSNGTIVSRMVEAKRNGKNLYEIIYPDGTSETGNTKILPTVQRILGFSNFYIDSKLSMPVNFYKQGEGWYLIGNNLTATDKARVVGALNGTNLSDAIIRDLDSENNRVVNANKYALERVSTINKELEDLKYLEDLKKTIDENALLLEKYKLLSEKRDRIKQIKESFDSYNEELLKAKKIISSVQNLDALALNVSKVKEDMTKQNSLEGFFDTFNTSKKNLVETRKVLDSLVNVEAHIKGIDDLKQGCNNLYLIEKYFNNHNIYIHNMNVNNNILNDLRNLEDMENILLRLNQIREFMTSISNISTTYVELKELKQKNNSIIRTLENIDSLKDKLDKVSTNGIDMDNLLSIKDKLNKLMEDKKRITKIIETIEKTEDLSNKLSSTKESMERITLLQEAKNLYDKRFLEGTEIVKKKNDAFRLVEEKEKEYENLLKEMQICPICKQPLEDEQIEHIIKGD